MILMNGIQDFKWQIASCCYVLGSFLIMQFYENFQTTQHQNTSKADSWRNSVGQATFVEGNEQSVCWV